MVGGWKSESMNTVHTIVYTQRTSRQRRGICVHRSLLSSSATRFSSRAHSYLQQQTHDMMQRRTSTRPMLNVWFLAIVIIPSAHSSPGAAASHYPRRSTHSGSSIALYHTVPTPDVVSLTLSVYTIRHYNVYVHIGTIVIRLIFSFHLLQFKLFSLSLPASLLIFCVVSSSTSFSFYSSVASSYTLCVIFSFTFLRFT